jgi:hypothetical protein
LQVLVETTLQLDLMPIGPIRISETLDIHHEDRAVNSRW